MDDATAIGSFVLAGTQVLTFFLLWRKMSCTEKREITPQPLEVREAREPAPSDHAHPEYQGHDDCEELHNTLNATLNRMDTEHSRRTGELRLEIKSDVNNIYGRIQDVADGLNERMTTIFNALGEVRGELKRVLPGGRYGPA